MESSDVDKKFPFEVVSPKKGAKKKNETIKN